MDIVNVMFVNFILFKELQLSTIDVRADALLIPDILIAGTSCRVLQPLSNDCADWFVINAGGVKLNSGIDFRE